ncbi:Hypothetical_protein [Hexamita inflata]|uniref:Hypothetical_protein n=1 Tax=Hexamita inflata TaxID=28002 RepID=A0AA86V1K7_9EUKA|nr:Hypothetical protein HINF_LOCUS60406 [Hexamita inflata]
MYVIGKYYQKKHLWKLNQLLSAKTLKWQIKLFRFIHAFVTFIFKVQFSLLRYACSNSVAQNLVQIQDLSFSVSENTYRMLSTASCTRYNSTRPGLFRQSARANLSKTENTREEKCHINILANAHLRAVRSRRVSGDRPDDEKDQ